MRELAGINKGGRAKLALIMREAGNIITVSNVAKILDISAKQASILLSRFTNNGWLSRIKRGVYVPVSVEARSSEAAIEDAWIVANNLFSPCYIGGWSALEHWGLTEQIFSTNLVFTSKKIRDLSPELKGAKFLLRVVYPKNFFGLKSVWRGDVKVQVSDPARTIVDILSDPSLGGGIRPVLDALGQYFKSQYSNPKLLIEYAQKLGNKAVFKRLGYLLEHLGIDNPDLTIACKTNLSSGNAQLDPALESEHLITRWRLWIPNNWKQNA